MTLAAAIQKLSAVHLLMASVVLVSLFAWTHQAIQRALMLNPHRVGRGQVHRLVTAAWIHGDLDHLIFNMLALFIFGDRVLAVLGVHWFLVLYGSAAVVAFIPTTIRYARKPEYNSLGASGAVSAVMLSAILLDPSLKLRLLFVPIPVPGLVFALGYLAYSAWQSQGSRDGINHDAHFSGAAYGILVTWLLEPARVDQALRTVLRLIGR
jgi:membrane associated rhomboid family serine protease